MGDLDSFLRVSRDLKVNGLMQNNETTLLNKSERVNEQLENMNSLVEEGIFTFEASETKYENLVFNIESDKENSSTSQVTTSPNNEELDVKVDSLLVKSGVGTWGCKNCSYTARQKSHVKEHVEEHIEGFSHPCNVCSKVFRKRHNLRHHIPKCLRKLNNVTI